MMPLGGTIRLLLYRIAGQPLASPLDELREVVDAPEQRIDTAEDEQSSDVRVVSLAGLLDLPDVADDSGRAKPLLVVDGGADSIGLQVDAVHGMIAAQGIFPVPHTLSSLPPGTIMGATVMDLPNGDKQRLNAGDQTAGAALDAWAREEESEGQDVSGGAIVLILDLTALVRLVELPDEEA